MEPIKEQILAFADWNDEENGEAVLLLTDDNVERLASLPEGVLKAALRRLRESQSPASSGYFIQPAVQDQVGAATFIVLEYPVDPTQERLLYFFGMGIFFRSRQAVAANFPGKWQVGKSIHILFPETARQAVVKLAERHGDYGYAILKASDDQPFVRVSREQPSSLRGMDMVLASFRGVGSAASCDPPRPSVREQAGVCSCYEQHGAAPLHHRRRHIPSRPREHHIIVACPPFSGNSGAALLSKDGRLIGMHSDFADALQDQLRRKRPKRPTEVDRSVELRTCLDVVIGEGLDQGFLAPVGKECVAVAATVFAK